MKIVNFDYLRKAADLFKALNHDIRFDIINLLKDHGSMTVTEIYIKLRIEQSVTSQHLSVLRNNDIVQTERKGKFIHYSVNKETLERVSTMLESLAA